MKGQFRKIDDFTLKAVGTPALEALAAIKRGHDCMGDIRGARNVQQHNLFWSLMEVLAEATDTTKEAAKEFVLKRLQYFDYLWLPDGTLHIKVKSIAFEKMEQAKFAELFNAAIPVIADQLGTTRQELVERFNDLLDPESRKHFRKISSPETWSTETRAFVHFEEHSPETRAFVGEEQ